MSIYQLCGLALCAVFACMIPGIKHTEYALAIRVIFGIVIFTLAISLLSPYMQLIEKLAVGSLLEAYYPLLLRAMGIALLTEITATVCRDSGEESVAKNIELLAKAEILILCLPLVKELIKVSEALLGKL
jgi:stage III sporulation protein AD